MFTAPQAVLADFRCFEGKGTVPQVVPMQPEFSDRFYDVVDEAFKDDPLHVYLKAGAKPPNRVTQLMNKRFFKLSVTHGIMRNICYSIDAGSANIVAIPSALDVPRRTPRDKAVDAFYGIADKFNSFFLNTREQRKRNNEMVSKMVKEIEYVLGEEAKNMINVRLLCVSPDKQGLGYGSALLNAILFMADLKGYTVYLFSSDVARTFYPLFGFVKAGSVLLGENNPTWKGKPIDVPLMVRKPNASVSDWSHLKVE